MAVCNQCGNQWDNVNNESQADFCPACGEPFTPKRMMSHDEAVRKLIKSQNRLKARNTRLEDLEPEEFV